MGGGDPAPFTSPGCLPCCQSNWRARLRSQIPELSSRPNPLQRTSLTSEPGQPMRRRCTATGRGRGAGQRWGRGWGSCGGPARALPHARATAPPSAARVGTRPPAPAPRARARHPQAPLRLFAGCAGLGPSAPPDPDVWVHLLSSSRSRTSNAQSWVGSAGYLFPTNLPAGTPLSQVVGRAELWFPAPQAPPLPSRTLALVASPGGTERVPAPLAEASVAQAQLLLVGGGGGPCGEAPDGPGDFPGHHVLSSLGFFDRHPNPSLLHSSRCSLHLPHLLPSRLCPFPLALPGFSQ